MNSTGSCTSRNALDYAPPKFCYCELKAPLCTARDSGRKFYGCKKWKDGLGCGFFKWKDLPRTSRKGASSGAASNFGSELEDIRSSISAMRSEIQALRELSENDAKETKMLNRNCFYILVVLVALLCKCMLF